MPVAGLDIASKYSSIPPGLVMVSALIFGDITYHA
jgi:hypothetical protein